MSAQALEVRMAHLEGAYEQINHRLGTVEQRLGNIETRMDAGFIKVDDRVSKLEQKFDQRFMWLIGLMIVSILLPVTQRFIVH